MEIFQKFHKKCETYFQRKQRLLICNLKFINYTIYYFVTDIKANLNYCLVNFLKLQLISEIFHFRKIFVNKILR